MIYRLRIRNLAGGLFFFVSVIALFCSSCKHIKPADQTIAYQNESDYWHLFRKKFPYHIQTVAIGPKESDSSFVLIISEPPPHVTLDSLAAIFQGDRYSLKEETNPIGYDGWVKDVTVTVSELSPDELNELGQNISKLFYTTDYKASMLPFTEIETSENKMQNVNYDITAAELYTWTLKDNETFVDPAGNFKGDLQNVLSTVTSGIFYSKNPGIVMWLLPKGYIDDYKTDARIFTVDSDLILGAVESTDRVAIIGRQRQTSMWELPPLRVETIMLLAGADKTSIAQSYERNKPFAGKLPGGKDWAPIYLSKDLINSEYGSLLNITDQLLKSWSENGEISYANFSYRLPRKWCFDEPMSSHLSTPTLLFNWNTKNTVYTVNVDNTYTVYALNRTGSLPVSYNPDDEHHNQNTPVLNAEDAAYDFFSSLNDPNLVRVVQYAALYEVFSKTGINSFVSGYDFSGSDNVIESNLSDVFHKVRELTQEDISNIIKDHLLGEIREEDFRSKDEYSLYRLYATFLFEDFIQQLQTLLEQQDENLNNVANVVSMNRDYNPEESMTEEQYTAAVEIQKLLLKNKSFFRALVKHVGKNPEQIRDAYVNAHSASYSNWIKTPSVVVSWSVDSAMIVGGHNIDVAVNSIQKDLALERGILKIQKIDKETKIFLSEADLLKMNPKLIAKYERLGNGEYNVSAELNNIRIRSREELIPGTTYYNFRKNSSVGNTKLKWIYSGNGERFGVETFQNQKLYAHPFNQNIFIPEEKLANFNGIYQTMKTRTYVPDEMQVLSLVKDDKTNRILESYLHNQLKTDINTITDLNGVFTKNQKKSFILFGHIEDKNFVMETASGASSRLNIDEIQALAKDKDVNLFLFGCESSFVNGTSGMLHKFNSIDAAERLGFSLKSNSNIWDFFGGLADPKLQVVINEVPFIDKGYIQYMRQKQLVAAEIYGVIGGTAVAATLVVTGTTSQQNRPEPNDTLRSI